jgi:HK97 family phage portal protein
MGRLFDRVSPDTGQEGTVGRATSRRVQLSRVTRKRSYDQSTVWACLRLRADVVSTMPVDLFRMSGDIRFSLSKPPVLISPGGDSWPMTDWLFATQWDLDSCGNTFGLITARDRFGLPAVIELVDADTVTVVVRKGVVLYRIAGKEYPAEAVWHERQYPQSGSPVGMSPIAHAAMTLATSMSASAFAADWFGNSTVPGGHLKNTAKVLKRKEALRVKEAFKATVSQGDVWVSGSDWEYSMLSAKASEANFLETIGASNSDVCRFLGCPGDIVDVPTSTSSITYASITQRNLQLLILHIGPTLVRRETAFSNGLVPKPHFVKLNVGALLRMDPAAQMQTNKVAIDSRQLAPSEARALLDRAPFTPDQLAEFAEFWPNKALVASIQASATPPVLPPADGGLS